MWPKIPVLASRVGFIIPIYIYIYICTSKPFMKWAKNIREPVSQEWQLQMIHLRSFQSLLTHHLINLLFFFPTLEMYCDGIFNTVKARVLATCCFPGTNQSSHLIAMESLYCPWLIIWIFWQKKKLKSKTHIYLDLVCMRLFKVLLPCLLLYMLVEVIS